MRKASTVKTIAITTLALFIFSPVFLRAQCCVQVTSTKSCSGKNTGTATVTPCTPGNYVFLWDDPSAQTGPSATGLAAGIYHVSISGSNFTCNPFEVIISDSTCTPPFNVPNIMTPNGDGINDQFFITGLENGTKLTVYDRWGTVIYSNNNYSNDWNPQGIADGVYFYVLTLPTNKDYKGKNDPSRGFVQIISGK